MFYFRITVSSKLGIKHPWGEEIQIFRVGSRTSRHLAIMCIGFLANNSICKHPQNQLVCVYQCLFTTFQILFDSEMFDIFKTILNH